MSIETVDYEFLRGANQMMRITVTSPALARSGQRMASKNAQRFRDTLTPPR